MKRKLIQKTFFLLTTLGILSLNGCVWFGKNNSVVFATSTTLGIDVSASEGGKQVARVGYERFEGVVMPHFDENDKVKDEAYSVISAIDFDSGPLLVSAFTKTKVNQLFATGEAAEIPEAANSIAMLYSSVKDGSTVDLANLDRDDEITANTNRKKITKLFQKIVASKDTAKIKKAQKSISKLVPGFDKKPVTPKQGKKQSEAEHALQFGKYPANTSKTVIDELEKLLK